MNRLRRVSAVAVAVVSIGAAGAFASGCGNDEANDYVEEINDLQLAYVDDVTALISGTPPTTAEGSAEIAGDLADLTQGLADDISAVDPPEEVADLHGQLVTTLEDVSGQITDAEETIASGNPQQAAEAGAQLQQATTEAQTQLRSIIDQINSTLQD